MSSNDQNDLLREFFEFGDDLILPDKPFESKKEAVDFEHNFDDDFLVGQATPSPSSSSTSSSSNAGDQINKGQSSA